MGSSTRISYEQLQEESSRDTFVEWSSNAVKFFHKYEWIFNFRTIDILFPKVLAKIPSEISTFFQSIEDENVFHNIFSSSHNQRDSNGKNCAFNRNWPSHLENFLEACYELSPRQMEHTEFKFSLPSHFDQNFRKKWSEKKFMEIAYVSPFVGELCKSAECDLIIDIGSGLGYLSSELAQNYKIDVLAVESNSDRVSSAQILRNSAPNLNKDKPGVVTEVTVELSTNISTELEPHTSQCHSVGITGLHCCGDLSPWCLQLFLSDTKYKVIGIIPCCYDKMKDPANFPLSQSCQMQVYAHEGTAVVRTIAFLRLASQRPGEYFLHDLSKETNHVFFRAILELYVHINGLTLRKIKRRCCWSDVKDFDKFIVKAVGPYGGFSIIDGEEGHDLEFHLQQLRELHAVYLKYVPVLTGMLIMQGAMQSAAENLILFDRLEFLKESGKVRAVGVKRVIPNSVSLRGMGIFGIK